MSRSVATDTISDLIPGYEVKGLHPATRFAVKPIGGARQRLKSPGRVPHETRPYQAGDPVNLIDWRAFGRTDQLLMRLQQEEAPMQVSIEVALHDSMHWPVYERDFEASTLETGVQGNRFKTKVELAWRLALFCAFAVLRRGDACQLVICDKSGDFVWRPTSTRTVLAVFHWLAANQFGLSRDNSSSNMLIDLFGEPTAFESSRKHGQRTVFISDGLNEDIDDWRRKIDGLGTSDLFVHLLSELEVGEAWLVSDFVYTDGSGDGASRKSDRREWQQNWLVPRIASARVQWFATMDHDFQRKGVSLARVTGADRIDCFTDVFDSWYGGVSNHR